MPNMKRFFLRRRHSDPNLPSYVSAKEFDNDERTSTQVSSKHPSDRSASRIHRTWVRLVHGTSSLKRPKKSKTEVDTDDIHLTKSDLTTVFEVYKGLTAVDKTKLKLKQRQFLDYLVLTKPDFKELGRTYTDYCLSKLQKDEACSLPITLSTDREEIDLKSISGLSSIQWTFDKSVANKSVKHEKCEENGGIKLSRNDIRKVYDVYKEPNGKDTIRQNGRRRSAMCLTADIKLSEQQFLDYVALMKPNSEELERMHNDFCNNEPPKENITNKLRSVKEESNSNSSMPENNLMNELKFVLSKKISTSSLPVSLPSDDRRGSVNDKNKFTDNFLLAVLPDSPAEQNNDLKKRDEVTEINENKIKDDCPATKDLFKSKDRLVKNRHSLPEESCNWENASINNNNSKSRLHSWTDGNNRSVSDIDVPKSPKTPLLKRFFFKRRLSSPDFKCYNSVDTKTDGKISTQTSSMDDSSEVIKSNSSNFQKTWDKLVQGTFHWKRQIKSKEKVEDDKTLSENEIRKVCRIYKELSQKDTVRRRGRRKTTTCLSENLKLSEKQFLDYLVLMKPNPEELNKICSDFYKHEPRKEESRFDPEGGNELKYSSIKDDNFLPSLKTPTNYKDDIEDEKLSEKEITKVYDVYKQLNETNTIKDKRKQRNTCLTANLKLNEHQFSNYVMLMKPSPEEFERIRSDFTTNEPVKEDTSSTLESVKEECNFSPSSKQENQTFSLMDELNSVLCTRSASSNLSADCSNDLENDYQNNIIMVDPVEMRALKIKPSYKPNDTMGYFIGDVLPDSQAERNGNIKQGDEIVEINGIKIKDNCCVSEVLDLLNSKVCRFELVIKRSSCCENRKLQDSPIKYNNSTSRLNSRTDKSTPKDDKEISNAEEQFKYVGLSDILNNNTYMDTPMAVSDKTIIPKPPPMKDLFVCNKPLLPTNILNTNTNWETRKTVSDRSIIPKPPPMKEEYFYKPPPPIITKYILKDRTSHIKNPSSSYKSVKTESQTNNSTLVTEPNSLETLFRTNKPTLEIEALINKSNFKTNPISENELRAINKLLESEPKTKELTLQTEPKISQPTLGMEVQVMASVSESGPESLPVEDTIESEPTTDNSETGEIIDKKFSPTTKKVRFNKEVLIKSESEQETFNGILMIKKSLTITELASVNEEVSEPFSSVTGMKKFFKQKENGMFQNNPLYRTVVFHKKRQGKPLGFTIVGGKDCSGGPLGIFVKSILPDGQAAESQQIKEGDEIISVNNISTDGLRHNQVVSLIKKVKTGDVKLVLRLNPSHSPVLG